MRRHEGWVAKSGAEGVLCAASPEGLGLALEVEDGAARAVPAALGAFLERLGVDPGEGLGPGPVWSSRGEEVGEIRARPA
jgi:L-asparaginase II